MQAQSVPSAQSLAALDTASAEAERLIADAGGRPTRTRVAALEAMLRVASPLSHDQLALALAESGTRHDRVTLYRALDWLVARGLVLRVAGSDRAARFEAARAGAHAHAHFHCHRCGRVVCLDSLQPSFAVALPEGFLLERAELVFHGACSDCGRG